MGTGRFDSIRVTHRYRVLVPAAAAVLAIPIAKVYGQVWPQRPAGQWPLRFAFYLVNCLIVAAAAACWYNGALLVGASSSAAAMAMLAALTSRWVVYAAGLPLTDSLYLLVFGLAYYGVRRGVEGKWALLAALLLGPLSKESFLLLVPWLLWFGRYTLPWSKQLLGLAGGVAALLITHYIVDSQISASSTQSIANAWAHLANITYSLHRAASLKGLGEVLSIFGLFTLIIPIAFAFDKRNEHTGSVYSTLGWTEITLGVVVGAHMLLSGDLGRMGYLMAPAFCAALALTFTHWRRLLARA
jgi:hypothetical protein